MSRITTALRLAVTSPRLFVRTIRFRHGPPRYRNLPRLVEACKPKTIVEIGVWRGDGAEVMIQAARKHNDSVQYWGFDLFEDLTPEMLGREISLLPLPIREVEQRLSGLGAEVTLVPGNTIQTVPETNLPPIDFAFIDGGHSYETVSADWRNLRPRLSPGAVVVFDDYTNRAAVKHEGFGIRALIDELKREYQVKILRPVDKFPRPYGMLEIQFAVLRMPSPG